VGNKETGKQQFSSDNLSLLFNCSTAFIFVRMCISFKNGKRKQKNKNNFFENFGRPHSQLWMAFTNCEWRSQNCEWHSQLWMGPPYNRLICVQERARNSPLPTAVKEKRLFAWSERLLETPKNNCTFEINFAFSCFYF